MSFSNSISLSSPCFLKTTTQPLLKSPSNRRQQCWTRTRFSQKTASLLKAALEPYKTSNSRNRASHTSMTAWVVSLTRLMDLSASKPWWTQLKDRPCKFCLKINSWCLKRYDRPQHQLMSLTCTTKKLLVRKYWQLRTKWWCERRLSTASCNGRKQRRIRGRPVWKASNRRSLLPRPRQTFFVRKKKDYQASVAQKLRMATMVHKEVKQICMMIQHVVKGLSWNEWQTTSRGADRKSLFRALKNAVRLLCAKSVLGHPLCQKTHRTRPR